MRLIDADKLINILNDNQAIYDNELKGSYYDGVGNGLEAAIVCVEHAPTVEERKHGHWEPFININREKTYRCSTCQNEAPHDLYGYFELTNYCPHCGTVMDEEASKNG